MDVVLENGKIRRNGLGLPETADGLAALLQRAYIRLNAVRGSFPYNRTLGSRIPQMALTEEHAAEQALSFAREALADCPALMAERVELQDGVVAVFLTTPLGEGCVTVRKEETTDEI